MSALDSSRPERTAAIRSYLEAPTAGSLWDCALGSDWPAADCGLPLLDGLDPDEPATLTPVVQSALPGAGYQSPRVSRVEVGGRTFYVGERGYCEGYLYFFRATAEETQAEIPLDYGWEPVAKDGAS